MEQVIHSHGRIQRSNINELMQELLNWLSGIYRLCGSAPPIIGGSDSAFVVGCWPSLAMD